MIKELLEQLAPLDAQIAALRGGAQDEESQMAAITAHASELAELAVEEDEILRCCDTPGAYPGKEAEERGQGEAIARNLMEMSGLTVPVIAVVTGEGSSGGALALGVANHILMLENAVYSVLSPEGFASILWKDSSRSGEACEIMKLTAQDLYKDGIVEEIIPEPVGGAQRSHAALFAAMDTALKNHLTALCKMSGKALADQRYKKFRQIGEAKRA